MKGPPEIVLFLGAGFSAPFGLPVMNSFLDYVRASDNIDDAHQKVLSKLVLESRQANSFLRSHPQNIEDILSFAEMRDRLGLSEEHQAPSVKRILRSVYSRWPDDEADKHLANTFAKLLDYAMSPETRAVEGYTTRHLSIVTTNYDLNAEWLLRQIGCTPKLGCARSGKSYTTRRGFYSQNNPDAVAIFKLHGSVNWLASADGETVDVNDTLVPVSGGRDIAEISMANTATDVVPAIVPPSFLKPQLSQAMRAIWSGAAKALSTANYVVFIGYSFPDTDTEMAYFLASSLWGNTGLSRIFIIDPNRDQIIERLSKGRYGSHFVDLLHKHPTETAAGWTIQQPLKIPFGWARHPKKSRPRS